LKNTTTVYSLKGPGSGNTQIQYAADDNISGTIDSANGTWNYAYDTLNRVSIAGGFSFDIDRNANRWHQNPSGAQISFDPATNRIASGNGVTYDAEGRIVSADAGSITYTYDAYGRRVRKVVSGAARDYVYDGGTAVAEVVAGVWQRAEIYVGGRHLATYSGGAGGATYFSHTDWLGTERVRTNVSGVVAEVCTSNAYGDALSCSGSDVSPIHYTGLERDTETGLDHAWFRFYNSRLGVWMTPDPAGLGAVSAGNPQSWNANAYVMNTPLNGGDPLGLLGPWSDVSVGTGRGLFKHPGLGWITAFELYGVNGKECWMFCNGQGGEPMYGPTFGIVGYIYLSSASNGPDDFKPWYMRSRVLKILDAKNDCSDWFKTGTGSAHDIMSNVPILLGNPTPGPLGGPDADTRQGPEGPITVAPDERFYTVQYSKKNIPVGGVYSPGSFGARMILLLHELAHKVNLVPPDGPLAEAPLNQSDINTENVMKHCQKAVDSASY
jgi:RHS repeat-associated protein